MLLSLSGRCRSLSSMPSTRGGTSSGHVRAPDRAVGAARIHKTAPSGNAQDVTLDQLHIAHMARHRPRQIPLPHDVTPRTARQNPHNNQLLPTVQQAGYPAKPSGIVHILLDLSHQCAWL